MNALGQAIEVWNGEQLELVRDLQTGAWFVIAIHSTQAGPARGGTRMRSYPNLDAAVIDVLALSRAMTGKFRALDFPSGGGKAVIYQPSRLSQQDRDALLVRFGAAVANLGGRFATGPDVGTSPRDMDLIARRGAPHVFCRTPENGGAGDSAPLTAHGVFHALCNLSQRIFGSQQLAGRTIAIQGVGSVGLHLATQLQKAGAKLLLADTDRSRRSLMPNATWVDAATILSRECDLLVPCALGGVLTTQTVSGLRCRGVVGGANNIFASPAVAALLHQRGILLAPDFIANAGGAVGITGIEALGWSRQQAYDEVANRVAHALNRAYVVAQQRSLDPMAAALSFAYT